MGESTFRPEMMKRLSISREAIENADDYGEIFDIADNLGVDLAGLDEIDDMKTRLLLYYRKCNGEPNYKDVVGDSMVAIQREDRKKREKLITLLKETREKLAPFTVDEKGEKIHKRGSAVIKGFLKSEGTIQNLDIDLDNKLEALTRGECTVVVSGETSAGKSSILNLLFGEDVVPTFFGSCTSVITRISYYRQRRAKIIYRNNKIERIKNIPKGEICQRLKPFLFVEDTMGREKLTTIKEVIIHVPAKILECGLVVVDSPGIGENEEMDKVIVNFVGENQISGFLYAIKSDNAGGVDEDRLLGLLKVIIEKEKEKADKGMLPFDPECALFVCNLWDLIREDQDELVFNHAYQRLQSLWPNMKISQMIKFSAHKAKKECDIDPDFIINNYKALLDNIKDLYCKAMEKRIVSSYKWLEAVLKRSVHHLKTIVHRIDNSEKELETKMKSVWQNLNTLKMKSELVISKLNKQIEEETDEICSNFRMYLSSPKTRMAVTSWIEAELPDLESITMWGVLKEKLHDLTIARISKELENWEEDQRKIKNVKESVAIEIQHELNILQEELQDIEEDLQSDTDSIVSDDSLYNSNTTRGHSKPHVQVQMSVSKTTLPVKLANRILTPFGKVGKRFSRSITEIVNDGKLKEYKKDPIDYAKRRSEKILQSFLDDRNNDLRDTIDAFMKEPKEYLKDIQKKIPAMVETNQQNMDHINMCRKEGLSSREMYEQMMEGLEHLRHTLSDYGQGYIFVNDFGVDDIQIETDDVGSGRSSVPFDISQMLTSVGASTAKWNQKQLPRGLWTAQQNGKLLSNDKAEHVTIKIYLPNARIENTDAEVAKLRLLKHENVAELLGIQNSSHPTPAFVFSGNLTPLGRYLKNRLVRIKEDIPRILDEILVGLEYIHRKKMVHMELNLNTITIDDDAKIVKLSGACRPKKAALPQDRDTFPVGDFIYISPEVLQGELYVSCADVYAFGLLVFEILVGPAFKDQRQWSLAKFANSCQPYALNGCPYTLDGLLASTQDIIQSCLELVLERRPTIEELLKPVSDIKNDPVLSLKKEMQRQQVRRKESNPSFEARRNSSRNTHQNESGLREIVENFKSDEEPTCEHKTSYKQKDENRDKPSANLFRGTNPSEAKSVFRSRNTHQNESIAKDVCIGTDNTQTSVPPSRRMKAPPLGKTLQKLSFEAKNYADEQKQASGQSSATRKSQPSPQNRLNRTSSETPKTSETDDNAYNEKLFVRLTKSLDGSDNNDASIDNSSDRRSPSQLRQS